MTFYMFFPDSNDEKEKAKIRKYKKQIEQEKQGHVMNLGTSEQHYKVLEQSKDHKVIDLQQPIKKNPTIKEFNEVLGL